MPRRKRTLNISLSANDFEASLNEELVQLNAVFFVTRRELVEVHAIAPVPGLVLPALLLYGAHAYGFPLNDVANLCAPLTHHICALHALDLKVPPGPVSGTKFK